MNNIYKPFATARPEKGQTKTQNLETSQYQAGFYHNRRFKMKKIIFSLILSLIMIAAMGNWAQGQASCCPAVYIDNQCNCQLTGVKMVTSTGMGNPSISNCGTTTIPASGLTGSYTGTYYTTPTQTTPTPDVIVCNDGASCVDELEWTYLGVTHDLDLLNGGQYGDPQDAYGNSTVIGIEGYMSCPSCPSGNAEIDYMGLVNATSGSPNFCPSSGCTCPPYQYVQWYVIKCH